MNAAVLLLVIRDVISLLESSAYLIPTGFDDTKFANIQADAVLAQGIEAILKKHGVTVPGNVDRVLQLLPILAGFIK